MFKAISIHALAKRATDTPCQFLLLETDFNPRPRKEGDAFLSINGVSSFIISIHALAKRATEPKLSISFMCPNFNPRPRKEGDRCKHGSYNFFNISIHALAKRATIISAISVAAEKISIHALAKRATS